MSSRGRGSFGGDRGRGGGGRGGFGRGGGRGGGGDRGGGGFGGELTNPESIVGAYSTELVLR